jgi:hypothetical protein
MISLLPGLKPGKSRVYRNITTFPSVFRFAVRRANASLPMRFRRT